MVAVLAMMIVLLVAYVGSTWATIANLRERNAELQAVLERRGGAWHEEPKPRAALPKVWEHDEEPTRTLVSVAPSLDEEQTERRVMVL
jgi:hypothetical protein